MKTILYFVASAICLSSCIGSQQIGYVTPTHNMPLNSARNDGHVMATRGFNHSEIQASYSPVKYVGLMMNYLERSGNDVKKSSINREIGIGGYLPFKQNFVVEAYALKNQGGIDWAYHDINDTYTTVRSIYKDLSSKYNGYSAQIDLGWKEYAKPNYLYYSFGIGYKISWQNFSNFHYHEEYRENNQVMNHTTQDFQNMNFRFNQFSIGAKFGWQVVRIGAQFSYIVSNPIIAETLQAPPYFHSAFQSITFELFIPNKKRGTTAKKE
jgi:hypothetical protein